jgi:hypothetical protein
MVGVNSQRVILPAGFSRIVTPGRGRQLLEWPAKNSIEKLDFGIDYSIRLAVPPAAAGDTIVTSTWDQIEPPDEGLVIGNKAINNPFVSVWLSVGAIGSVYALMNNATTAQGRIFVEIVYLRIRGEEDPDLDFSDAENSQYIPLIGG